MQDDKVYRIQRGGLAIEVIEYGARLKRCLVPDAAGDLADVVPGFSRASDYAARGGTMGAVLGRYGNRIGHGRIAIRGTEYQLSRNDGEHTMHGGAGHFGTRWWKGAYDGPHSIILELVSEDGDQGWPGTMTARVNYTLTENFELRIDMQAICDCDTFVNMLFHGYWNLAGHGSGSVHAHLLKIAATRYTPKGPDGLPTGQLAPVEGTPFDFRQPKPIGANIAAAGNGYAHNLCLQNTAPEIVRPVAWMVDPLSGRALTLKTDQPGVQLFTANSWSNLAGKDGAVYNAHSGLALETQLYPNTPNTPEFSPRLLRSGGIYCHRMVIGFSSLRASEIRDFFETDL
ncbi:aldose epimerase family protein [Devosia sp. ZW T5_3]|uniref:aldose epimerase family protein n=1 Tax=Devosia sp. ZW T5_3 TaxID=3378085 RepID=UPI003852A575